MGPPAMPVPCWLPVGPAPPGALAPPVCSKRALEMASRGRTKRLPVVSRAASGGKACLRDEVGGGRDGSAADAVDGAVEGVQGAAPLAPTLQASAAALLAPEQPGASAGSTHAGDRITT